MIEDTIAAISTPPGTGGIGIIRLSGKDVFSIVNPIFRGKKNQDLSKVRSHTIHYGYIIDKESKKTIDEVLVMVMKAPNTYTKEDIVEINCHGGIVSVRKVLEQVLKMGARLAEPGEFTKRAFLNGRIDLSQAEAVIDIIEAKTDMSLSTAMDQLEGSLSHRIGEIREELLEIMAHIEAAIDYPEYDIEELGYDRVRKRIEEIRANIHRLLDTADSGKILREGVKTAIVGKPNVGKSSLLNALLREQRAIVTNIPGTTRDVLEEYINISGVPFKLIDTAGIRETEDVVEQIGVNRSKEIIESADLIIMILDLSTSLTEEDMYIMNLIENKKKLVLLNKTDLPAKLDKNEIYNRFTQNEILEISAKNREDIERLEETLKEMFMTGKINMEESIMITNLRHKDALIKADECLKDALSTIDMEMPEDCLSIDLTNAYKYLGEITGESVQDDLIQKIFSQFCLGK
ncbi:MAG: tRNA modification GTPase [Epulopiscium sp.]|jgi:tRNA modification GTPase|uniref:tRNA modification GTPase MnmE n=1 Tax=Defluviitalea raffinosedens TaxID=1450156 RepID=A0A7C8HDC7_9FIRM|nr:tRNA uridine-5-carboxymethylaminomethyl(34) synthesis GTPase MnmE [Defluviitalea raffinosedens]MBZ4667658.1 mnmE [Defluviitaleaceae bacterium]MDK2788032.1 tRNA modification GTPase [Candidatus Epulonipiscium sp.]KAE9630251.1 tRNA uridine-5-carboxymethylaminomethyl(34) synthesis GTPase MnmE [Defluviitalea raffinosedens]MBM7686055.1 tRNA modification GTPase [Defluviitalea raffinosedens]HHW67699.1 tRNA uridine-5-carboxymethylaminomethyl(34) synthesis GTPase MnmE [Candidatus Epulonipiscium sp.]